MTPTRFRECLTLLRWSQRGLADALQRDESMIRKMARGAADIPGDLAAWLERRAEAMRADPPPAIPDARKRQDVAA
jgi:ribosome-binding protein aMBF1 (putative translation factor)